jgi:hypothetical protein
MGRPWLAGGEIDAHARTAERGWRGADLTDLGPAGMQDRGDQPAKPELLAVGYPAASGDEKRQQQGGEAEPMHGGTIRDPRKFVAVSAGCGARPLARHIHSPHFSY